MRDPKRQKLQRALQTQNDPFSLDTNDVADIELQFGPIPLTIGNVLHFIRETYRDFDTQIIDIRPQDKLLALRPRNRRKQFEKLICEELNNQFGVPLEGVIINPRLTLIQNASFVLHQSIHFERDSANRLQNEAIARALLKSARGVRSKDVARLIAGIPLIVDAKSSVTGIRKTPYSLKKDNLLPSIDSVMAVAEQPVDLTIRCTPQFDGLEEIAPKSTYRFNLYLDQRVPSQGADVEPIEVNIPSNMDSFVVNAEVYCSSHFRIAAESRNHELVFIVPKSRSNTVPVILSEADVNDSSPMFVAGRFSFKGRPSGRIIRYLDFRDKDLVWSDGLPSSSTAGSPTSVLSQKVESSDIPRDNAVNQIIIRNAILADVRIEVRRDGTNASGSRYILSAITNNNQWRDDGKPLVVNLGTKALVTDKMTDFINAKPEERESLLLGAGREFWKALPEDFRTWLWDELDSGRHKSISVLSEEPYIPWELMRPVRGKEERPTLGMTFQIGRWITGDNRFHDQQIIFKSGFVICPTDSGLANATAELEFLTKNITPPCSPVDPVVPATFSGINNGLQKAQRNFLHFICHGENKTSQTLLLEEGGKLIYYAIRDIPGFRNALSNHPVVFLNACKAGSQARTLDGIGGFAPSFIDMGAAAVIAPLWSVSDSVALDVTKTFYRALLKGSTFGSAIQEVRSKAFSTGEDSYAAYCLYGDPLAFIAVA